MQYAYFESVEISMTNDFYHLKFLIYFSGVEGNTLADLALKFK